MPSSLPGFFPDIMKSHCRREPFHLPTLGDGIDLILGLLDGVHLGASALAGFPSLHTLEYQGTVGFHGVNVFQSDSRNKSMIVTLVNKQERSATAELAKRMVGQKTYHSWPYLQEGLVVAVSDDLNKYELRQAGGGHQVVATPHNPFQAIAWKKSADLVEHHYSKRFGVIIGNVDVLLHVRPLKGESVGKNYNTSLTNSGLKRLDTGALVKDYEAAEKEMNQAFQLAVTDVAFEDERYIVSCLVLPRGGAQPRHRSKMPLQCQRTSPMASESFSWVAWRMVPQLKSLPQPKILWTSRLQ